MARKPMTPPKKPLREWRITLIRAKGQCLGRASLKIKNPASPAAMRIEDRSF